MAGIDKIYGNKEQYYKLYEFIRDNKPEFLSGLRDKNYMRGVFKKIGPNQETSISSFSPEADKWLYINCPFDFVTERIKEQYNIDQKEINNTEDLDKIFR